MKNYTQYSKDLYKSIDNISPLKRPGSALQAPIELKGRTSMMQMSGLGVYTDRLKYGNFNWPVRFTSVEVKKKKKKKKKDLKSHMLSEVHFDTLFRVLQRTDWSKTPLYQNYKAKGRWIHNDEEIFSELEVSYLKATLTQMTQEQRGGKKEEFGQNEGRIILREHWTKTVLTLERLMAQMNMMYYFEKLRAKLPKGPAQASVEMLAKMMSRCTKLYGMIDSFMNIFKLIDRYEKLNLTKQEGEMADLKRQNMLRRMTVCICLLLKENP